MTSGIEVSANPCTNRRQEQHIFNQFLTEPAAVEASPPPANQGVRESILEPARIGMLPTHRPACCQRHFRTTTGVLPLETILEPDGPHKKTIYANIASECAIDPADPRANRRHDNHMTAAYAGEAAINVAISNEQRRKMRHPVDYSLRFNRQIERFFVTSKNNIWYTNSND
ncbi:hypothetical protein [Acidiphilium sp. MT5]